VDDLIQRQYTEEGENLKEIPWNVYPRPQLRRTKWACLNGSWDFETVGWKGKIMVPFCAESLLSGFDGTIRYGEDLRYGRTFSIPEDWQGMRVRLHFGAVNSSCEVRINDRVVGRHENGYLAFSFDVTDYLEASGRENRLEVIVKNDLSGQYPWGKQKEKRGGMWYTPSSGIWQTVWMEPVPEKYVEKLEINVDLEGANISVVGMSEGILICEGRRYEIVDGSVRVEPENARTWSPEDPCLYEFTIQSGEDEVASYFALRTISISAGKEYARLFLNQKPYFFNGILDQGYYSDGLYTPADPSLFEKDVLAMKELGFNTLRKHLKVEPEQFYYDCDRLGMIVFQDMVNNGDYKFMRDTIWPTFGIKKEDDRKKHRDPKTREAFLEGMRGTVEQLRNHSCICYWTIFNEGWGQFEADKAYEILKQMDPSRIVDATSGWFQQSKTDVESKHLYFEKLHLGKRRNLPQVLSEFGGYVYKIPEHSFHLKDTYGYRIYKDRESFAKAFVKTYLEKIVPMAGRGLSAAIYTQVSDVEDETNGMLTYDRRVCKLDPEETKEIEAVLQKAVREGEFL